MKAMFLNLEHEVIGVMEIGNIADKGVLIALDTRIAPPTRMFRYHGTTRREGVVIPVFTEVSHAHIDYSALAALEEATTKRNQQPTTPHETQLRPDK
jgi:hypothetical protein